MTYLAHLMRGYHYCEFCEVAAQSTRRPRKHKRPFDPSDVAHGNGEIWVASTDGMKYAAPVLLIHYIDEHQYLPPPWRVRPLIQQVLRTGIEPLATN